MYHTRILIRGDLFLSDLPAVVVAAGFRHEDLDDLMTAPMVNDDFPPSTHSESGRPRLCPSALRAPLSGCVRTFEWIAYEVARFISWTSMIP